MSAAVRLDAPAGPAAAPERMTLRVVDIETTGSTRAAEVIEIGYVDVICDSTGRRVEPPQSRLYRPLRGVPAEVMAVHHLTEEELSGQPVCTEDEMSGFLWSNPRPDAFVAHNCEFERAFIGSSVTQQTPWICTYKLALRAWPEAPKHSNQVLRYWRGHRHDARLAMPPHRAAPDAFVTAHLLLDLLDAVTWEDMLAWTQAPRHMPRVPFGKHRGVAWADVPADYLSWMLRQSDMDPDTLWAARQELQGRTARIR